MLIKFINSLQKLIINLKIKKFLKKIGIYNHIKNIYRAFIIFIGRNGLELKIQDVSVKILVSTSIEASIWQSLCNEKEILRRFLDKINNHTVFYDIGAHIGLYSLTAAKHKIAPKFVYCWEPEPFIFKRLNENIRLNNIKNIMAFRVALGSENTNLKLWTDPKELGSLTPSFVKKSSKSVLAQVVKGDDWVNKKKLYLPSIIKIDVEGYEFNVLRGFEETIRKSKPIIFLEISPSLLKNLGFNEEQVLSFLYNMDYKIIFSSHRGSERHYVLSC